MQIYLSHVHWCPLSCAWYGIWINMRTYSEFPFEFLGLLMPTVEWPMIFHLLYPMLNSWRNTRDWNLSHGIIKDIVVVMFWNSIFFHGVTSCRCYFTYTSLLCNKLSWTSLSVHFVLYFLMFSLWFHLAKYWMILSHYYLQEIISYLPWFPSLYKKVKCVY